MSSLSESFLTTILRTFLLVLRTSTISGVLASVFLFSVLTPLFLIFQIGIQQRIIVEARVVAEFLIFAIIGWSFYMSLELLSDNTRQESETQNDFIQLSIINIIKGWQLSLSVILGLVLTSISPLIGILLAYTYPVIDNELRKKRWYLAPSFLLTIIPSILFLSPFLALGRALGFLIHPMSDPSYVVREANEITIGELASPTLLGNTVSLSG